jgi:hypothetical protein
MIVHKRICGQKRDDMERGWRKLYNEELHNLYSSPSVMRMIKSRGMRWAGHVARMGRGMHTGFWWEIQKEENHSEDLDVGGRIILKWIFEK